MLLACVLSGTELQAQSLKGTKRSMDKQVREMRKHDYDSLKSRVEMERYAKRGYIVPIPREMRTYRLSDLVSHPYARPEVKLFIERASAQYIRACGEKLVVTSLTRTDRPGNGSDRSVHPAGMAVDFRYSQNAKCRKALESILLPLEGIGVLEATRERKPKHYHVVVFPEYSDYVAGKIARVHVVRKGENLSVIARRYKMSVAELKRLNGQRSDKIRAGQKLKVKKPR